MCGQEGDEAVRGPSATLRDSSQVECGNHSSSMLVGNLSLSDCLSCRCWLGRPGGWGGARAPGAGGPRSRPATPATLIGPGRDPAPDPQEISNRPLVRSV